MNVPEHPWWLYARVLCCCSARRSSAADLESPPGSGPRVKGASAAAAAAAVPVQLLNDSYAMQAARRAQKRRLCDMIRLLDYMLADAIHSMLLASLQHLLQCLHGVGQVQQVQVQPQQAQQQEQQQVQVQQHGVVLQLHVLLHEQVDQLYLQPQAAEFMEGLSVWLRSVQRVVRGVPRLMSSSILQVSSRAAAWLQYSACQL